MKKIQGCTYRRSLNTIKSWWSCIPRLTLLSWVARPAIASLWSNWSDGPWSTSTKAGTVTGITWGTEWTEEKWDRVKTLNAWSQARPSNQLLRNNFVRLTLWMSGQGSTGRLGRGQNIYLCLLYSLSCQVCLWVQVALVVQADSWWNLHLSKRASMRRQQKQQHRNRPFIDFTQCEHEAELRQMN